VQEARVKIEREHLCAKAFEKFLASNLNVSLPCWSLVPKSQQPPDFYLSLGEMAFAVEITSTEVMRDAAIGGGQVREEEYELAHIALVRELETEAIRRGLLRGAYVISFPKPLVASKFSRAKEKIILRLLEEIEQAQALQLPSYIHVEYQGQKVCDIQKVGEHANEIFWAFEDGGWVESSEFVSLVLSLLQHVLIVKKTKLEKKREYHPAILLLLNTYPLATPEIFQRCVNQISATSYFHTIYLVNGDGTGSVLYSKEKDWI
jgi:hypothetical protein